MRIRFDVQGIPPKKDGANSMWRKSSELDHLIALREAAAKVMFGLPLIETGIKMTLSVHADPRQGDLDNFITGICDGLMAAHTRMPVDGLVWEKVPEAVRPDRPLCFRDDILIQCINAERLEPGESGSRYTIVLEW